MALAHPVNDALRLPQGGEKEYYLGSVCNELYVAPTASFTLRGFKVAGAVVFQHFPDEWHAMDAGTHRIHPQPRSSQWEETLAQDRNPFFGQERGVVFQDCHWPCLERFLLRIQILCQRLAGALFPTSQHPG